LKPLLEGDANAEEALLLRAGFDYAPEPEIKQRLLKKLGLLSVGTVLSIGALKVLSKLGLRSLVAGSVKLWLSFFACAAIVVTGSVYKGINHQRSEKARTTAQIKTTAPIAKPVLPEPSAEPVVVAMAEVTTPQVRVPSATVTSLAPPKTLSDETEYLERARNAMTQGKLAQARKLLAQHNAEFPNARLTNEARVLTIETMVASGDKSGARKACAEFLTQFPKHVLAGRVRSIANMLDPDAGAP
jgi:Outer membrane lipoprotein